MAKVDDWFWRYADRLTQTIRINWPASDEAFWTELRDRFGHHGVAEDEAVAVLGSAMDARLEYANQVWPKLLLLIEARRASFDPGRTPYAETNRQHAAMLAARDAVRPIWLAMSEAEREKVRAEVLAEAPNIRQLPGSWLERACLDRLAELGWSD